MEKDVRTSSPSHDLYSTQDTTQRDSSRNEGRQQRLQESLSESAERLKPTAIPSLSDKEQGLATEGTGDPGKGQKPKTAQISGEQALTPKDEAAPRKNKRRTARDKGNAKGGPTLKGTSNVLSEGNEVEEEQSRKSEASSEKEGASEAAKTEQGALGEAETNEKDTDETTVDLTVPNGKVEGGDGGTVVPEASTSEGAETESEQVEKEVSGDKASTQGQAGGEGDFVNEQTHAAGQGQGQLQNQDSGGGASLRGGRANFTTPDLGPVSASTPETLGQHQVESVIGTDAASGKVVFWGDIGHSELEAQGHANRIPQTLVTNIAQNQAQTANDKINQFLTENAARVASLEAERTAHLASIKQALDVEKARLSDSISQSKSRIKASFKATRKSINDNASLASKTVDAELVKIHDSIDNDIAQIKANEVTSNVNAHLEQVAEREKNSGEVFRKAAQESIPKLRQLGESKGQEAIRISYAQALAYGKEALPEASLWQGSDYHLNRRNARVEASKKVGDEYQANFLKSTQEAISAFEAEFAAAPKQTGELYKTARDGIQQSKAEVLKSLTSLGEHKKAAAKQFADAQKAGIENQRKALNVKVSQEENAAFNQLNTVHKEGTAALDTDGAALEATVTNGYGTAAETLNRILDEFRQSTEGECTPDTNDLAVILADYQQRFSEAEVSVKETITQNITSGQEGLRTRVDTLLQTAAEAETKVTTLTEEIKSESTQVVSTVKTQMSERNAALKTEIASEKQERIAAYNQTVEGILGQIDKENASLAEGINKAVEDKRNALEGQFSGDIAKLPSDIRQKANEAADSVPTLGGRIISFVTKVVVAVASAIFIAALFASGVGILGLIVGGFAIGAIGAMITYGVDCLCGLQKFSGSDLLINAVVGGVGGVIGVLTAGLGGAAGAAISKGLSGVAQALVNFATAVGVNTAINSGITFISTAMTITLNALFTGKDNFKDFWSRSFGSVRENLGVNILGAVAGSIGKSRPSDLTTSSGLPNSLVGNVGGWTAFKETLRGGLKTVTSKATVGDMGLLSPASLTGITASGVGAGIQTFGGSSQVADLTSIEQTLTSLPESNQASLGSQSGSALQALQTGESGRPMKQTRK